MNNEFPCLNVPIAELIAKQYAKKPITYPMFSPNPPLTLENLKAVVVYDPASGIFTDSKTNEPWPCILNKDGYVTIKLPLAGVSVLAHRMAWYYMLGKFPNKRTVDHKNQIKSDNRWDNLREATHSENMRNRSPPKHNKSGVAGVHQRQNGNWKAEYAIKGKVYCIGTFFTLAEATKARENAIKKHYGEFAHLPSKQIPLDLKPPPLPSSDKPGIIAPCEHP